MKMNMALAYAVAAVLTTTGVAVADDEGWMEDLAAAKSQAGEEGKDLLLDFTGSDWCGWCIKLHKEVFATEEFKAVIHDSFVLVKLDFPRDKSLVTEEIRAQNTELQEKYAVRGFPTIFLTDAAGLPYAKTGYRKGGPVAYLEHLTEFRAKKSERDGLLEKAGQATGLDRAKLLDAALGLTSADVLFPFYQQWIDEIIELDDEDNVGLKSKYQAIVRKHEIDLVGAEVLNDYRKTQRNGQWFDLEKRLDAVMDKYPGEQSLAHKVLFFKALAILQQDDFDTALEVFEEARKADPEGAYSEDIPKIIEQINEQKKKQAEGGEDEGDEGDGG